MSVTSPSFTPEKREPGIALQSRYGTNFSLNASDWNTALETILSHRSVRAYLPESVPENLLELGIAAAQSAPTSSNLQAWSVVAVEDAERRKKLAELASPNPQIISAPLFLVWIADLSRLRKISTERGHTGEGLDYLESLLLGTIDAALAAQNALVAFEALGLGTCYIGGIRNRPEEVAKVLALPSEAVAVFGMTVGYPDHTVKTAIKPRLPQSLVLHREQYQTHRDETELVAYDERIGIFQADQGMAVRGWQDVAANRIADTAALKGRHAFLEIVRRMGFKVK